MTAPGHLVSVPGQGPAQPLVLIGEVRHARRLPAPNAFAYRSWCLLLPMRSLARQACAALNRNRFARVAFHDRDHGDGGADALAWIEGLLQRHGVHDADGEIWLQTYPRLWGMVFKPVSFWFCLRADQTPAAIVAEVNNTFGERHCYVLPAPSWGATARAAKVLQVSPFMRVEGDYAFRFLFAGGSPGAIRAPSIADARRAVARIEYHDGRGGGLVTSLSGELRPLDAPALADARRHAPALMPLVILRIHAQAVRLWLKRVPFHGSRPPDAAPAARAGHPSVTPTQQGLET